MAKKSPIIQRFWRHIKKNWQAAIATAILVLTALAGILDVQTKIWNIFFGRSAKVSVRGDYVLFKVADEFKIFRTETGIIKKEKIEELLPNIENNSVIAYQILSYIQTVQPTIPVERLNNFSVLMTFALTNTGNQEAQNVELKIPTEGFYKVIRSGNDPVFAQIKNRQINIGSIRPTEEVLIAVWGDKPTDIDGRTIDDFPKTDSVIAHFNKDEIAYAIFPTRYYGYWDLMSQHSGFLVLSFVTLSIGLLILFAKANSTKNPESTEIS